MLIAILTPLPGQNKNHMSRLPEIFCTLPVMMARSLSNNAAIHYLLTVLWLVSCFRIMGPLANYSSDSPDDAKDTRTSIFDDATQSVT